MYVCIYVCVCACVCMYVCACTYVFMNYAILSKLQEQEESYIMFWCDFTIHTQ